MFIQTCRRVVGNDFFDLAIEHVQLVFTKIPVEFLSDEAASKGYNKVLTICYNLTESFAI